MSINLTLDRIHALSQHLPPYTRPTCHIAGTNGKGSVSAILSSVFAASSLAVGRFTSPHLLHVHDCITINGQSVDAAAYYSARSIVELVDREQVIGASSFELLTLTALLIFEAAQLDIVVIEVGLGGRLDATNVISDTAILVSALTAVDLDHTSFLGGTVEEIAREKAAIARQGKVLVVGKQRWPEAIAAVRAVVQRVGTDLLEVSDQMVIKRDRSEVLAGPSAQPPPPQPVRVLLRCFDDSVDTLLPLQGEHQVSNLGVAVAVIETILTHPSCAHFAHRSKITPLSLARGIQSTSWPGRLSWHLLSLSSRPNSKVNVLVDGAHNPASTQSLANYISSLMQDNATSGLPFMMTYILAQSGAPQKSPTETLAPLFRAGIKYSVALVGFSAVEDMPWVEPVDPSVLGGTVRGLAPEADVWWPGETLSVDGPLGNEQLFEALNWAIGPDEESLIVVAGSLYLVADFYRLLDRLEGKPNPDRNATGTTNMFPVLASR